MRTLGSAIDTDLQAHADGFDTDHGADHDARDHSTALGTASVGDLADVDTTTTAPTTGDRLEWDGTKWIPAAGSATSSAALPTIRASRSSGVVTLNAAGGVWTDVDTGLDIVIDAVAGDVIEITPSGLVGNEAVTASFDVLLVASSNTVSGGVGNGVTGWYCRESDFRAISGGFQYVVLAADVSAGQVTCRLRYKLDMTANRTFYADSSLPFKWSVTNFGQ